MKREHTQKAMILLILCCIVTFPHFAFGQNGNQSPPPPPFDERLPNDECERLWGIGKDNQFGIIIRISVDKSSVFQVMYMKGRKANEAIFPPKTSNKMVEIQDATGGNE
jgi:hypothetical protein